ncbi:MAG: hypothetical protein AAF327_11015 [Cyanobacteria bacterium P01_A01_bin.37]
MKQLKHQSLHAFAKQYGESKTRIWKRCQELGINCSKGLSPASQQTLIDDMDLTVPGASSPEAVEATIVPTHSTELLAPNGYGKTFDLGAQLVVNINVHTGNAGRYWADSQNSDANVQSALATILQADQMQGEQDAEEVEAIAQAVKSKRIETRLAGHVGKQQFSSESQQ